MEEENTEVLFESWGFKYTGSEKKKLLRISSDWKKQYFVLLREDHVTKILCYDKKPRSVKEKAKLVFELFPEYSLRKQFHYRDKPYVCILSNPDMEFCAGFEEEKIFHLFCFFVQTQTHLKEEFEEECFVMRPDNSDGHRKLGSRGNMCLLHVSQWGITLALQLSKCVLAQWPLKAIKWYESSARQQFGFEAGRKSPMGAGIYVFNTRPEQDNMIYDKLDGFVMEAAGFKQFNQMTSQLASEGTDNISMSSQLLSLQSVTTVYSDARFSATLKRISRDIYDHLSQHLGGSVSSNRPIGSVSNDLFSDDTFSRSKSANGSHRGKSVTPTTPQHSLPHSARKKSQPALTTPQHSLTRPPKRQISQHPISPIVATVDITKTTFEARQASPIVPPRVITQNGLGVIPRNRPYENNFIEEEVMTARKIKEQNFTSSYFTMNSTISQNHPQMGTAALDTLPVENRMNETTMVTSALPEYSNYSHNVSQVTSSPREIPKSHVGRHNAAKTSYCLAQRVSDPKDSSMGGLTTHSNRLEPTTIPPVIDSYSPVTGRDALLLDRQKLAISNEYTEKDIRCFNDGPNLVTPSRQRLQSRSLEDFSQYERMSNEDLAITNYLYHNEGFRMSDEVPSPVKVSGNTGHSPGIYSYTSHGAVKNNRPPKSPGEERYNSIGDVKTVVNSLRSPPLPALRQVDFLQMHSIYARPLPKAARKSRSIPNLTEIRDPSEFPSRTPNTKAKVTFENNNNTIEYCSNSNGQEAVLKPPRQVEALAFANNMFKEELDTLKHGSPVKNVSFEEKTSPSKPSVKPKPVLSLFRREASHDSSSSTTSGIRSMSTSPISPFPTTNALKSPGPGVQGIMFTPKTKSFKRPQGGEASGTTRDSGELSARPISGESVASTMGNTNDRSLMRRKGSTSSAENRMEGRRLPSLPPDAILNEDLDEMGTAYAKVEETLC